MFTDIIQPTHLLLILVVALLVLGPKRLPEVGRSLGRGLRDFRHGLQGVQDEARGMFNDALDGSTPAPVGTAGPALSPRIDALAGLPDTEQSTYTPVQAAAEPAATRAAEAEAEAAAAGAAEAEASAQPPQFAGPAPTPSAQVLMVPSSASVTKVVALDLDPADYAD